MDLIEDIGPILGIVAFLGFSILALLIVLQAREVRRLREWAGRAPERAAEADEAAQAAFEATSETTAEPGRIGAARERLAGRFARVWAGLDRRSPIDPRWFLALLLAGVIAAGVLTSGFGLVGGDEASDGGGGRGGDGSGQNRERQEPTVAVLNATQDELLGVPGVSGLAEVVANDIVKPAGFKIETRADAPAGEEQSVIMFAAGAEADAEDLAAAVEPDLGPTEVTQMTGEVRAAAEGADLALLIGSDDQGVVGAPAATTAP